MNPELQAACRLAEELREMDAAQLTRDDRAILALYYEVRKLGQENATFRAAQKACEDCDAPTMAEVAKLRELIDKLPMKNPHIIVGEPRRCLCGMYEGQPTSCADILAKPEIAALVLTSLVQDCGDGPSVEEAANLEHYVPMSHHGGVVRE